MANLFLITTLILTTVHHISGIPRTIVTEAPNYPSKSLRAFNPKAPSAFISTVEYNDADSTTAQQRSPNYIQNPYLFQNAIPIKQKVARPHGKNGPQQFSNSKEPLTEKERKELEEEEEIEEPDRLSILLPQSKFECTNKNGYYADQELGCEVFHYCQDNARHSWICPEGFTFHQVHLICMPPGGDNNCEKSSQFHFVNEYLYKPVNLEEYQQKPNVSLRYSERYYPDNYYEEAENEQEVRQHSQHRNSVRVQDAPEPVNRATFRPETTLGQVYRTSGDINIPLQQRRPPQYVTQKFFNNK